MNITIKNTLIFSLCGSISLIKFNAESVNSILGLKIVVVTIILLCQYKSITGFNSTRV